MFETRDCPVSCVLNKDEGFYISVKAKDMVYLENIDSMQLVYVPKVGVLHDGQPIVVKLRSTIGTKEVYEVEASVYEQKRDYWVLALSLGSKNLNGEYEYSVCQQDEVLATGLLIIGTIKYAGSGDDTKIKIKQYGE